MDRYLHIERDQDRIAELKRVALSKTVMQQRAYREVVRDRCEQALELGLTTQQYEDLADRLTADNLHLKGLRVISGQDKVFFAALQHEYLVVLEDLYKALAESLDNGNLICDPDIRKADFKHVPPNHVSGPMLIEQMMISINRAYLTAAPSRHTRGR